MARDLGFRMPPARLPIQHWGKGRRELEAQGGRTLGSGEGNTRTPIHPICCVCSGWATVTGSESLQDSPPLATHGQTQENQGAKRTVDPGGSEKHPHHRSHARPPRGHPAAAHMRAHIPPQPPADTCRRPRSHTTRSAAASRFFARTTRSRSALARVPGLGAQRVTRGYLQ